MPGEASEVQLPISDHLSAGPNGGLSALRFLQIFDLETNTSVVVDLPAVVSDGIANGKTDKLPPTMVAFLNHPANLYVIFNPGGDMKLLKSFLAVQAAYMDAGTKVHRFWETPAAIQAYGQPTHAISNFRGQVASLLSKPLHELCWHDTKHRIFPQDILTKVRNLN